MPPRCRCTGGILDAVGESRVPIHSLGAHLTAPGHTGARYYAVRRRYATSSTVLARRRWRFRYLGSGSPSSPSLATTTPMPGSAPMKRPRILFWSRQNSNVSGLALFGIKPAGSASISTISRATPRPCVRLSQSRFASFSQASRIAADEYLGLFVIDLPPPESMAQAWPSRSPNGIGIQS